MQRRQAALSKLEEGLDFPKRLRNPQLLVLAQWRLDKRSLPSAVVMSLVKVGWDSWRYHDSVALVGTIRFLRLPSVA